MSKVTRVIEPKITKPEFSATEQVVSLRELQRLLEQAWQDGYARGFEFGVKAMSGSDA